MRDRPRKPATLGDLRRLLRTLRGPGGCPWDREQTLASLKQYLLEECYEVLDAIDRRRPVKLREELGDLLFLILFAVQLCEEQGVFVLDQVIAGVHEKMVRRHPHVFGDCNAPNAEAVRTNWWKIKQTEGERTESLLASVPRHLPALQRAFRLGMRASRTGMDWPGYEPVLEKVREEIGELEDAVARGDSRATADELGDLLFAVANLARHLKQNPEEALQRSNEKFLERFRRMEYRARVSGVSLESLCAEERDRWWEEAKGEGPLEETELPDTPVSDP